MSLSIQDLSIAYGSKSIINDMSLPLIHSGSLVAVLGANAVGKSTLLKTLAGLLNYSGTINLYKQSLLSLSQQQRMQMIGYLPQTLPQASTLVAYELVYSAARASAKLNAKQIEKRVEEVFASLGIRQLALRPLREMSGGQRQMIGLAQVLVREPYLFLLDEPTSALDLHWQLNVLQAIKEETEKNEAIAFIASHDLNLALRFCDQILMLTPGGVLAMGKPQEVLTPENLKIAYGIEGRIESCSEGHPIVLADRAATNNEQVIVANYSNVKNFTKSSIKQAQRL